MDILLEKIFEWIRQGFIEAIMGNFSGMYDTINQRVGDIAGQVGQTPGDFGLCYKGEQEITAIPKPKGGDEHGF